MMLKRSFFRYSVILGAALVAASLAACGGGDSDTNSDDDSAENDSANDDSANDDSADDDSADDRAENDTANDDSADDGSKTSDDSTDGATSDPQDADAGANDTTADDSAGNTEDPDTVRGRLAGIRDACEDHCDAQFAVECHPFQSSIVICDLQCVAVVANNGEFCLDEYEAQTRCLADGGYECVQDRPVPKASCRGEQVAYAECASELPCKLHCAALVAEGCSDDETGCREQCFAERDAFADSSCRVRYDLLISCSAQQGLSCENGNETIPQACYRSLFDYHDCVNEGNLCETWCAASNAIGCADDGCQTRCESAFLDEACGDDYRRLLECGVRYGNVECQDGELTAAGIFCDSELERYQQCMTGQ